MRDLRGTRVAARPGGLDAVIAGGGIEAGDESEFGEAAFAAAAAQHRDEIDGLGDQRLGDGDDGFLDELFEAADRAERRAGVDGADPAGMAGAPGLEQVQRLGAADLADRDAVGPKAQRGADEVRQRGDAVLGAHRDEVRRAALQFAGVLDQHHAVAGAGDLGQQRVGERGLARATVPPATRMFLRDADGRAQRRRLPGGHGAGGDVVVEGEDGDGGLADGEGRRRDDGRQQPLEPLSRLGQLGGDARALRVNLGADMVRDQAHDPLAIGGGHGPSACPPGRPDSRSIQSRPSGLSITSTMVGSSRKAGDGGAERSAQHARAAGESLGMERSCRHDRPRHWPTATRD